MKEVGKGELEILREATKEDLAITITAELIDVEPAMVEPLLAKIQSICDPVAYDDHFVSGDSFRDKFTHGQVRTLWNIVAAVSRGLQQRDEAAKRVAS